MLFEVALNQLAVRNECGPIALVFKRGRHQTVDVAPVENNVRLVSYDDGANIAVIIAAIGVNADPVLGNSWTHIVPWSARLPVVPDPIRAVVLKLHPRLHQPEPPLRP